MNFDAITNYYERQVYERVMNQFGNSHAEDPDFLADIACVALNALPPRYIRHPVDMAFYMSSKERDQMEKSLKKAISDATDFVRSRRKKNKA